MGTPSRLESGESNRACGFDSLTLRTSFSGRNAIWFGKQIRNLSRCHASGGFDSPSFRHPWDAQWSGSGL